MSLRSAIFYQQEFGVGLRPYSALGATGEVPVTKMNLIEVASYANMNKDSTELGLTRIFKYIHDKFKSVKIFPFRVGRSHWKSPTWASWSVATTSSQSSSTTTSRTTPAMCWQRAWMIGGCEET